MNATEKFLLDLKASTVASTSELDQWLEITKNPNDPGKLADLLVANGNLTRWQANYLLSGRNRLRFGSYVLLDFRHRNRVGEKFVGRHEQLDRKVNILFLARDVSSRLAQDSSLIKEIAAAGDVDHPNLEHVHLIDRESDRYMLVTDFVKGRSLNDSELLVSLKPVDLPGILCQAMQAMAHQHAAGFAHGNLTEQNFVLDSNQKLTVTNLVESMLARRLDRNDKPAVDQTNDDIQAIARIGRRLVARLSAHDTTNITIGVKAIIDSLAKSEIGIAEAIASLNSIQKSAGKSASEKTESDRLHATSNTASTPDVGLVKNKPADNSLHQSTGVEKTGTLKRKLMFVSAALMVATIAVLTILRFWFDGDTEINSLAQHTESAVKSSELPSRPLVRVDLEAASTATQSVKSATSSQVAGNPPRKHSELDESSLEDPNVDLSKVPVGTDRPIQPNPADPSLTDVQLSKSDSEKSADESATSETGSILSAYQSVGSVADLPQNESTRRSDGSLARDSVKAVEAIPGTVDRNPTGTTKSPAPEVLPESVDLPPDSNTESRPLFTIESDPGSLELELVSDKNISRSNIEFELSAGPDGEWTVQMLEPGSANKIAIAIFAVKDGSLEFNWSNKSEERSDANYLRNCVLRLRWDHGTKAIALRKPIIVEGFRLDREKPQIRLDIPELAFLPKNPVVELLELDENIYGTTFLFPEERTDRLISGKNGLEIHFSDLPEFQMAHVVLFSEMRNRPRLEAALMLRLIPDQKSKVASNATLETASHQLEEYFQSVKLNHDALKGMKIDELRRQLNLSSDQFKNEHKLAKVKEFKQEMELSEKRSKSFRELRTRLEAFYDRPIPISIRHEVDGQRVILATTLTD